jgi:hypothetical protein
VFQTNKFKKEKPKALGQYKKYQTFSHKAGTLRKNALSIMAINTEGR